MEVQMLKKTKEQKEARLLRISGCSVIDIARHLHVSKGSVSSWVRDIPQPIKFTLEFRRSVKKSRDAFIKKQRLKNKKIRKKRLFHGNGYWLIPAPKDYKGKIYNGGYIYEHRYILEKKIGRILENKEFAHHINGNSFDNRPENLQLISKNNHAKLHMSTGRKFVRLKCPACGNIFEREKNKTFLVKGTKFTACSKKCVGIFVGIFVKNSNSEQVERGLKENFIEEFIRIS